MLSELIAAFGGIAVAVWREWRAGTDAEEIKRNARDRADVAIDSAIAKRRLAERRAKL